MTKEIFKYKSIILAILLCIILEYNGYSKIFSVATSIFFALSIIVFEGIFAKYRNKNL